MGSVEIEPSKSDVSRRDFLKLLAAAGVGLAFTPFIPWGKFMPNPSNIMPVKAEVVLPDGTQANVKTFPKNHSEVITYPLSGDPVLDKEPFKKWQFIRLPDELGGGKEDVSAFRAYSMVCLHLWCLWKYWPQEGRKRGECPCHGSMYNMINGKAFAGPASLQAAPSNVLPILYLETDSDGNLWIKPAIWDVNQNGIVGYGRFLQT
ncbi:MAG: twin-arginine translocation signal domain-containing protein [Thaumarchaeota archaeon]|nr:twin-arginine translocation signal domain-containing protein [Nitrososphaerota archaeon]MDE1831831.1 twin-arginine translocation signal domain-containing protein [Nitrososphaerota archaeon]MDE1840422.1 twin-arginine translocation signal domain-containing protein [Nitrososphaerota archaeon]MDE1877393.1 twin-arginine translocation signal domain-containing protein [Nitrososphaerota archaeon]